MLVIGFCPHCNADVHHRTRGGSTGRDTCVRGHVYPSMYTLTDPLNEWVKMIRDTLNSLRDYLDEQAEIEHELKCEVDERQKREWAARCRRTLEAVPLSATVATVAVDTQPTEGKQCG